MKMRLHYRMAALFAAILLAAGAIWAQTNSGEIRGRVVDPADAVVIDADVTLINPATGDTRTAKTDKAGEFIFVALQPGKFNLTIQSPNFKKFEKKDLQLSASERLSAGTMKLTVGAVSETLSVTAEATPIQTESSERSALLDGKELSSMMSIGRDPLGLIRLLPGVVKDGGGGSTLGTQGAGTIAGVRESSNAISIDGMNGNPRGDGNKLDTPINMDALAEIKVVMNSYQAEYGGSAGAIINLVTKSGTQNFHGSGYYYGRNEFFNANSWNNDRGQYDDKGVWAVKPKGQYRYNTIGWNVGGPVYIPGKFNTNKDKLFFFFSQERWPTKSNSGYQRFTMPTLDERKGDFSKTFDKKGNKVYIADPEKTATGLGCSSKDQRGCFPNNVIPADRINPSMQKLMGVLPLPTIDCSFEHSNDPKYVGVPGVCPLTNIKTGSVYNYSIYAPKDNPTYQTLLRLDYNLNSKWRMYFRGQTMLQKNSGLTSTTDKLNWGIPMIYKTPSRNATFNVTYVATPTLVNEAQIGYSNWNETNDLLNKSDYDKITRSGVGFNLAQNNPGQNPLNLVPRIHDLDTNSGGTTFGIANTPDFDFDNRFPMDNMTGTWQFTDSITKIWNRHTIKAGVLFMNNRYLQKHIGSVFNGSYDFRASNSSSYDTQYSFSNMLLGNYYSYQEGNQSVNYAPHWNVLEWYLQDSWKMKSNLTVDYGMRFMYDLPTTLIEGQGASFVPERYDKTQAPRLYDGVLYSPLSAAQQAACKKNNTNPKPTRCAQNPITKEIFPEVYIGTFVSKFDYTGTVVNTDKTYPRSLRNSNGLLFAPRLGFSWDPFKDGKTAIRMGAGIFYNSREGAGTVGDYSLIAPLSTNGSVGANHITANMFQPGCGSTQAGCYGTAQEVYPGPVDTRVLQKNRKIETTINATFGIQRKIGFDTVVDVGYVGTFGRHLNEQINLNAMPYGATVNNLDMTQTGGSAYNCFFGNSKVNGSPTASWDPANYTGFCQPKTQSDNYLRYTLNGLYGGYGSVNLRDYGTNSNYNSLQTSVNRRFTKGFTFGMSYTWSKALTFQDTVNGGVANYQDRRWYNYSEASFDRRHNFSFHWTAAVPKASSLWNNRILKAVGDNWEWSGLAEFVSGAPISIGMSGAPGLTYGGDGARPILVGDPYMSHSQSHTDLTWFNRAAFAMPCPAGLSAALIQSTGCAVVPVSADGHAIVMSPTATPNMVRNVSFAGPGTNNWDMSLQKNVPIKERVKLTFRVEAYNIFNHPSFNALSTTADFNTQYDMSKCKLNEEPNCGSGRINAKSTFGQITGGVSHGSRTMQLSGRITF